MTKGAKFAAVSLALALFAGIGVTSPQAGGTTVKGWISDESCARGRAKGGRFTGTNPDCAKKCIGSGAKTVLIVPDQKILLTVDNPAAAKADIGDFVEITGNVDAKKKTLHIDSLKMLTKGAAMCDAPQK